MRRIAVISALCVFALTGCDRSARPYGIARQSMMDLRESPRGSEAPQFSFGHFWSLAMRRETIKPRFERARIACLSNSTLKCKLVASNIEISVDPSDSSSSATLDVLLPHDKIENFRKSLLAPVVDETTQQVVLQSSSSRAENVESESADADRKIAQLSGYRDRLTALSRRPNLSIEDTIRLEAEISRVQGVLDDAVRNKMDVDNRVAREAVNITLNEFPRGVISDVWNRSADIFSQSIANALEFLIGVVPWLPIVAGGVLLASWLLRLVWRRKQKNG